METPLISQSKGDTISYGAIPLPDDPNLDPSENLFFWTYHINDQQLGYW